MSTIRVKPTKPAMPGIEFEPNGDETLAGGLGGWETLERPRSTAATAWVGTPAATLDLPLLLEGREVRGIGRDRNVEGECQRLERWGLQHRKTGEPPILRVDGLLRVSGERRWVIQGIAWGEYVVNDQGRRVSQQLTLSLLEYSKPEMVRSPAKRARKKARAKKRARDRQNAAQSDGGDA